MPGTNTDKEGGAALGPPPLARDAQARIEPNSLADLIQWFLTYDQRVAVINHPAVEELFQWKQAESERAGEGVYVFNRAEDRLAVGIMQALTEHDTERELHGWISQLLNALEEASKTNEAIAESYNLSTGEGASVVSEAVKLPTARERAIYLTCCWLETLCTAEIRVLGWVYQELYRRPFSP